MDEDLKEEFSNNEKNNENLPIKLKQLKHSLHWSYHQNH